MKVPIKVLYHDGCVKHVVGTARDAVEFERHFGMSFAGIWGVPALKDAEGRQLTAAVPPREEWWYFFAHSVLSRTGEDARDFERFVDAIESVTFDVADESEEDVQQPVPFDQAPADGSSPSSAPTE